MSTTKTDLGEVLKKGFETSSSIFFGSLKGLKSPQSTLLLLSMASTTSREASLVAQMVKNPPAIQEIWVWSLGQEDPLEKGLATHSSFLAWEILWIEELGVLLSMGGMRGGSQKSQTWLSNWTTAAYPNMPYYNGMVCLIWVSIH